MNIAFCGVFQNPCLVSEKAKCLYFHSSTAHHILCFLEVQTKAWIVWNGARLNGNKMSASIKAKELSCSVHVCVVARVRLCVLVRVFRVFVRVCVCVCVCVASNRLSPFQKRD